MLRFLLVSVILLYLFTTLFPQLRLDIIISIFCILILLFVAKKVKKFVLIFGSIFLISGFLLLWIANAEWYQYLFSFGPMLDLLTLFSLVPILGIPIKLGEYSESVKTFIHRKVQTTGHLYILTSAISYFFSIFMNLATLPMTYYSIKPVLSSFPIKEENRFISRSITRGFAMPLIWAPVTPIVGIVITMTGVSWIAIFPFVLPLSIIGLSLDWFLSRKKSAARMDHSSENISLQEKEKPSRLLHILLAILIFNIIMSIAESFLSYSFIILVSLLVIPFSFTWSWLLKKQSEYTEELLLHFKMFSISMKDQFFIFLSAGFFISTMKISHSDDVLTTFVIDFIKIIGTDIFILVLPLIPLAFAFLGLHPAVSLSLIAGALDPNVLGISPFILTIAMLVGAVSAFMVGPYNATLGLMSNIIKESSFKISNWNIIFTSFYIGTAMIYILILKLIIFN